MGRVAGSYGVRGSVKVAPSRGADEGLVAVKEWWIGGKAYEVAEARAHSGTVVAKLLGVATREQALTLKGSEISVRREALAEPAEGHYYHADLLGLEVVNGHGEALGTVKRFFSNGAQDVMEVQGTGKAHLIPWVPAVVKEVDLKERKILVEWELDW
jgi:16S rRNA processing protein RimM